MTTLQEPQSPLPATGAPAAPNGAAPNGAAPNGTDPTRCCPTCGQRLKLRHSRREPVTSLALRAWWARSAPEHKRSAAARAGVSFNVLGQIVNGHKRVSLGTAEILSAVTEGGVPLHEWPLSARAREQLRVRASLSSGAQTGGVV